ncbi:rieske domain-containing protein [Colletotrichum plurivorum]|uniref:Rieske domain-containing protein n=1 Tax=Colletotrichum plurivorum TaxID=2175906 RepID=A0A8H6K4F7_9PEZI|nr:rieske domain-containing protein [Colletotrichum plurivorum]
MPQVVELGWIPVKQDYEENPITKSIRELKSKLMANPDLLAHWEGVRGHGRLDDSPIKGLDLATVWKSVEASKAAKESPEGQEMGKLWPQIVETSSHYGPVQPWVSCFLLEGDDFAKVASANVVLLSGSYLPADADTDAFFKKWVALTRSQHAEGGNLSTGYVAGVHGWSVGDTDHKGEKHKVFMVVTGWDSEEQMKAAVGGDKRAKVEEALKEFGIQQHEHVSHGLDKIK